MTTNPFLGMTTLMTEFTPKELLAALAYSDLKDLEVAIRVGNRYIVGSLSSIEILKDTGILTRFKIEGIVVND